MNAKDCANLYILAAAFNSNWDKRDKRIAIVFHKNQRLNIGNQYQKDTTYLAPGIIEKFEYNVISHQIDETVKEGQMKHQKISKL